MLGSYTTFDAPTSQQDEALEFLKKEFNKIDGNVRKISNPHDFGNYPSFEIDYPIEIGMIDDDGEDDEIKEKDQWHDDADAIYARYNKKFEKYL